MKLNTQLKVLKALSYGYPTNYPSLKEKELIAMVLRAHGVKELRCLSCSAKLTLANLRCWGSHDGGINGEWYYLHCPYCGYDTSIEKILKISGNH